MKRSLNLYFKFFDFDVEDADDFDHYKGAHPKRLSSPSVSLFSAKKPEKYLISTEIPIDSVNIDRFFRQDSDLTEFSASYLQNYDIYFFDKIFTAGDSQELFFYSTFQKAIGKMIDGENSCLILTGNSRGLKNYVLRGGEDKEKGVLIRTYNEIVNLLSYEKKKYKIFAEASLTHNENIIPLLSENNQNEDFSSKKSSIGKGNRIEISSLGELKNIYNITQLKIRNMSDQLKDSDFPRKVHFEFSFLLEKEGYMSRLTLIRLKDENLSDYEIKKLKSFLSQNSSSNIPEKDDYSLFTYHLSEKKFNNIAVANIFSPNTKPKLLKNLITLAGSGSSNNNNPRPPTTPHYKETLGKNAFNESFKEKKMLIDKDISNLMDRYNSSKKIIDSIPKKPQNESKQLLSLEKDILRLKNQVVDKLDSTNNSGQKTRDKILRISEIASPKAAYPETSKNSIQKMKGVFEEKERILLEKLENFKKVNESLKENLRIYIEKKDLLEEEIKEKEAVIEEFERNVKNYEDTINNERDIKNELKEKIENLARERENLTIKNGDFQQTIDKKNQKIQCLKQKIEICKNEESKLIEKNNSQISLIQISKDEIENKLNQKNDQISQLTTSLQKKESELQQKDEKVSELLQNITFLEKEISSSKEKTSIANLKALELNKEFEQMKEKYREVKESLQLSEAKILKTKTKFEEEKKKMFEEKNEIIAKKMIKYKSLKESHKELTLANNELLTLGRRYESENTEIKKERDLLLNEVSDLKQINNSLSEKFEMQSKEIQNMDQEKYELQLLIQNEKSDNSALVAEFEKIKKTLKNAEKKIQEFEEISKKDNSLIIDLKTYNANLDEENTMLKNDLAKLSNQTDISEIKHREEINELEKKFEMLIAEIKSTKEENQEGRNREHELRKTIISLEEELAHLKEKYLKIKFTNKELKKHLKEVEAKLKDYVTERQMEIKEIESNKENAQKLLNNKLKILDDIQGMVQTYRKKNKNLDL